MATKKASSFSGVAYRLALFSYFYLPVCCVYSNSVLDELSRVGVFSSLIARAVHCRLPHTRDLQERAKLGPTRGTCFVASRAVVVAVWVVCLECGGSFLCYLERTIFRSFFLLPRHTVSCIRQPCFTYPPYSRSIDALTP